MVMSKETIEKNLLQSRQRINKIDTSNKIKFIWMYAIVGVYIFMLGATNWLKKIQRPQDEITNIQLEMSRIQLHKERANSQGLLEGEGNLNMPRSRSQKISNIFDSLFQL